MNSKSQTDSESKTPEIKMLPFMPSTKVSSLSIDDVERDFVTHVSTGLDKSEAERRARIYGLNEFDAGAKVPIWRKYFDQVGWLFLNC